MPGAVADLTELGVALHGRPIAGIRYVDGLDQVEAAFRSGPGRGVRRTTLHAALADASRRRASGGAAHGADRRQDGERVLVDGEPARYLVAADGLHSPVRRLLGLEAPGPGRRRCGLRCHLAQAPWTPYVEVHWRRAPRPTSRRSPTTGRRRPPGRRRRRVRGAAGGFPLLRERLAGPGVEGAGRRAAAPAHPRRVAGRVLLVGDAAGYVDALTGEGIAVGLAPGPGRRRGGRRGRPGRYERGRRRLGWRHDLLTRALLEASRRPRRCGAASCPRPQRVPWLFAAAVNQLARPA